MTPSPSLFLFGSAFSDRKKKIKTCGYMQMAIGPLASHWVALQSEVFLLGEQVCLPCHIVELWGKNFCVLVIFAFKVVSSEKL